MGKKSLLAPTSEENTGSEKSSEKEKKPLKAGGAAKKAASKSKKKKAAITAKKRAAGSKTAKKKASPKTAKKKAAPKTAKKKAAPKSAKKKAAPKKPPEKKKAPSRNTATAKSSAKPKAKKAAPESIPGDVRDKVKAGATSRPPEPADSGKATDLFSATRVEGISPEEKKPTDPTQKMAVVGLAVLALLLVMVLWSSVSNVGKFYIKQVDGQVEIWKGRFSPKGMDKIYTLSDTSMLAEPKDVYSKEEAYALIFEGVIAEADALLRTEEMPDFELIRRTLAKAEPFAVTNGMSQRLQMRLDKIDMMALVYKADILAGKGTVEDLTHARESLEKAMGLNLDEAEKGLIEQKISWVDQKLKAPAEE